MSQKSNKAFNSIKNKWRNDDERQTKMETRRMIKYKRKRGNDYGN